MQRGQELVLCEAIELGDRQPILQARQSAASTGTRFFLDGADAEEVVDDGGCESNVIGCHIQGCCVTRGCMLCCQQLYFGGRHCPVDEIDVVIPCCRRSSAECAVSDEDRAIIGDGVRDERVEGIEYSIEVEFQAIAGFDVGNVCPGVELQLSNTVTTLVERARCADAIVNPVGVWSQ